MRVACLTLMRRANATLTLVPPLLNSKQFRAQFTADLDDPEGLRGFWEWYESTPATLRAQVIGPVLARLRSLLLRDFVRRTIGSPHSSFDMGKVLDGGLLIARLPKGQLGEETAKLMGSFVFASVWQAATARSKLPEAQRRDAVCYVDEAHNVLNLAGSVGDMLAEARGYHLSLVLAHQTLSQLPRELQLALSANARNKLIFACSPEDSHQLARHTLPELDEHDLAHLDRYTAAVRLIVDARQTPAFTLRTRPPLPVLGETTALRQAVAAARTTGPLARRVGRRPAAGQAVPNVDPDEYADRLTADLTDDLTDDLTVDPLPSKACPGRPARRSGIEQLARRSPGDATG
ncbi:type IV secretory system conjugative DNA transfer family protein [Dactylosporangium cerinum]